MGSLADEVAEMRCELQKLSRKQLQTMAKEYNIKANMKSEDIIDALLRAADRAGSSAAALSAAHHRLARSSSMGPEDELVSCFPGTSSSAGKAGMKSQLASFGKALVGLVTKSPVRDNSTQHMQQQSQHSAGSSRATTGSGAAADSQLPKDQQYNALLRTQHAAGASTQQQQTSVSYQAAAAAEALPSVTAQMSSLAVSDCPAAGRDAGRDSLRHLAAHGTGQQQLAVGRRPVTASTEAVLPQQPPPTQQRPHSSPGKGGRHRAEVSTQEAAAAGGARSSGSSITQPVQQQQAMVQASKLLHTPQRTASAGSSLQRKRWVVPQQDSTETTTSSSSSSSITTAGIASSREACVTPPRQALPSTTASGAAAAGLQSPRLSALGSARRIVLPAGGAVGRAQLLSPRRAGTAAAAAPPSAVPSAATAAGATPLKQPPRRLVPGAASSNPSGAAAGPRGGVGGAQQRGLEAQLTAMLTRAPRAKPGALDGPEPAKQWLTRCVVGPYKRSPTSSGAGYCYCGLLLGGPNGCGKTELAVAVAAGMGAGLLYVTPTELQDPKGHVLQRALFQSARNKAPCVLCLDDAHVAFPAQRHPDPEHPSHRLRTELLVQLEQLGEEQAALAKAALAGSRAKSGSVPAAKGPSAPGAAVALPHPVVVLVVSHTPDQVDPALAAALHPLTLGPPAAATREDLLAGWALARDAALSVEHIEQLVRRTAGWSMRELVTFTEAAAASAARQGGRAVSMADCTAALAARSIPRP